jgi:hypothetical protein
MKPRRSQPRPCQWMNQTEDEDEDEDEDEQQSSETKHEPNEEKKRTANGSPHNIPGRKKSSESLKTRTFKRDADLGQSCRSLVNPAFFWRTRKRRKRKRREPSTRTFSREGRRWRLSLSFKFFHATLTSFRLVRSRCSHVAPFVADSTPPRE